MRHKDTWHMPYICPSLRHNKKGIESEGVRFNTDQAAIIIIFLVLLAILIILVIPAVGSGKFNETAFNFGKNIYDIMLGKGD